jgi:hypothetical protein
MPAVSPPRAKATRADVLATLAIVGVTALAVLVPMIARELGPRPTPADCEALLDRYVEHVAYAIDPKPASSTLIERRALAHAAASSRAAFSRCQSDLTRSEVECAMKADSADSFERCLPAR